MSNKITIKGVPISGPLVDALYPSQLKLFSAPLPEAPTAASYREQFIDVPVDVPSRVNRDTELKNLTKILKEAGGFDMKQWTSPKVARMPDGTLYLFDGDHSRAIYRAYYPQQKTMPAKVIDIDTIEEYHLLFVRYNAKGKTPIRAEDVFVHMYHAKDTETIELAKSLTDAGLFIYCSHEEEGTVGDREGMRIKVGAAKTAFKTQAKTMKLLNAPKNRRYSTAVRDSVAILKSAGLSSSREDSIPGELLEGLVMLLGCYPSLRPQRKDYQVLRGWLRHLLQGQSVKQTTADLKAAGGNQVNFSGYSVACGILKALGAKPKPTKLKDICGDYSPEKFDGRLSRFHGPKR